jgi:hypothetical protein
MRLLFRQIVPYQKENGNLIKISSADLFGQIVIWNLNDKVNICIVIISVNIFEVFIQ